MSEPSDEDLMLAYRDGEAVAFETLYGRHKGPLYRYLLRQCGGAAAIAEELFQDVWMKLINRRAAYQATATFRTYLFTIAHNRLVDYYRAQQNQRIGWQSGPRVDDCPADASGTPERSAEAQRQIQRLFQLIDQLPAVQREAFLLQQEAGLNVEEIAAATNVNRETAKSRLRYAIAKLRQGMTDAP